MRVFLTNRRHRVMLTASLAVSCAALAYIGLHVANASTSLSAKRFSSGLTLPQGARAAVDTAANRADVDQSTLYELKSPDSSNPYLSTVVGTDRGGAARVAMLTDHSVTSFAVARDLFKRQGPLLVFESTRESGGQLNQLGVSILVKAPVDRVFAEFADGSRASVDLIDWPNGPYSSATLMSTDSKRFPVAIDAYGSNGRLLERHQVDMSVPSSQ